MFNLGEIGIFYTCIPNKTMIFKNETCSNGILVKERLAMALGANATGTEKFLLLIID